MIAYLAALLRTTDNQTHLLAWEPALLNIIRKTQTEFAPHATLIARFVLAPEIKIALPVSQPIISTTIAATQPVQERPFTPEARFALIVIQLVPPAQALILINVRRARELC